MLPHKLSLMEMLPEEMNFYETLRAMPWMCDFCEYPKSLDVFDSLSPGLALASIEV